MITSIIHNNALLFIIGHKGTTEHGWQYAVIELFRFYHILLTSMAYYHFDNTQ